MKVSDFIKDKDIKSKLKEYPDHPNYPKFLQVTGSYTINIIDTLESFYLNFKEEHNEKIKEIFELIDIDTLIRPDLLKISQADSKLIKEKFGTEFNTVEYNDLVTDISEYLEYNKAITKFQNSQIFIEEKYKQNQVKDTEKILYSYKEFTPNGIYEKKVCIPNENDVHQGTTEISLLDIRGKPKTNPNSKFTFEGYTNVGSYMNAGDYRLCSVDILELNKQENALVNNRETFEKRCYILFACNKCIVLENENYDLNNLLENFTDIKLIDNCTSTPFKEILHKRTFNSFTECQSMYNTLKSTLPKETIDTVIENKITNYINWNYQITEDVKDKIKVLELYNLCKQECHCAIDSRQFSKILLKLNLKKKRYQDGIYYYGLNKYNDQTNMTDIKNKLFDGLLQEREPLKSEEHLQLFDKMKETRYNLVDEVQSKMKDDYKSGIWKSIYEPKLM